MANGQLRGLSPFLVSAFSFPHFSFCQSVALGGFAQGGFDVVGGNPHHIRQELFSPFKLWLEAHYEVLHGMADPYRSSEAEAAERVF